MRTLKDIICFNCKKVFTAQRRLNKNRYFCSPECYRPHRRCKSTKSYFQKGHAKSFFGDVWNKGKVGLFKHTEEWKNETSERVKKHWMTGVRKGGWKLNLSNEAIKNRRERFMGEKNPLWKGGITPINAAIRTSYEYKQWRKSVMERDNYTCQLCRSRGEKIHVDHIKPFSLYPELRFDISNGRVLCVDCHKKTPTYLNKALSYQT